MQLFLQKEQRKRATCSPLLRVGSSF